MRTKRSSFFILFLSLIFTNFSFAQWELEFDGNGNPGFDSNKHAILVTPEYLYTSFEDGLFRRSNTTFEWDPVPINNVSYDQLIQVNANSILGIKNFGTIARSMNEGQDFESLIPFDDQWASYYFLQQFCGDQLLVIGDHIVKSNNLGESWFPLYYPIPIGLQDDRKFNELNGLFLLGGKHVLAYSYDCGDSWTDISNSLFQILNPSEEVLSSYLVNDLFILEVGKFPNGNTSIRIYASNDLGETWSLANGGLPEVDGTSMVQFLKSIGNILIIGIENHGVYYSTDSGISWNAFNEGFPQLGVAKNFEYDDTYLYTKIKGHGLYKRPIADIINLSSASGKVYRDLNGNNELDPDEPLIVNQAFSYGNPTSYSFSDFEGKYQIVSTFINTETISPIQITPYAISDPPFYQIDNPADTFDFAISFPSTDEDLKIDLSHSVPPRPGFSYEAFIQVKNVGAEDMDAEVIFSYDSNLIFIESSPSPTSQAGNTLSWDLGQLLILESENISIQFNLPANIPLGTEISQQAEVLPNNLDINPSDNVAFSQQTVVGSFDPNDIQVDREFYLLDDLDIGVPLTYTIRFQNTGTYLAETVRIEDWIDPKLDIGSIEVINASHPFQVNYSYPRTLEFLFEGIQLPDSLSNEPESHGFIKFQITPYPDIDIGASIFNEAEIYFDFNDPITTNSVFTYFISELGFYPVQGIIYHDLNENSNYNDLEPGIPNQLFSLNDDENYFFSNPDGHILINLPFDETSFISPIQGNPYAIVDPPQYVVSEISDSLDFAINFLSNGADFRIDAAYSALPEPGALFKVYLTIENIGSTGQGGDVRFTLDPNLIFTNATPIPDDTDDEIIWHFPELDVYEKKVFEISLLIPSSLDEGYILSNKAEVLITNDASPDNNIHLFEEQVTIENSSNSKEVDRDIISNSGLLQQEPLYYTIRFQNNTDSLIQSFFIEDLIDENLNLETFKIVSASHPYRLEYKNPRTIDFIFEEINLPDSTTNEAASHGFIKYQIAPNSDLQVGELIENTASIYFDFNDPIITNTVQTILAAPTWVEENAASRYGQLIISPNPNGGHFTILIPGLENHTNSKLDLYNSLGHKVWAGLWEEQFDFTNLSKGVYLMKFTDSAGKIYTGKVLINN